MWKGNYAASSKHSAEGSDDGRGEAIDQSFRQQRADSKRGAGPVFSIEPG